MAEGALDDLLGVRQEILIRVDRADAARDFLAQENGCRVQILPAEEALRITPGSLSPAELNQRLVQAGFRVHELRPIRHTLEEYFLNLTGPGLDSQRSD